MSRTYTLFGCAPCHTRWWTTGAEPNPGHVCPKGYPPGGLLVAKLEDPDRPKPHLKAAA
jgi:hypothetical protein